MKKCSIGKLIYWMLAVLFSAVFIYPVYFTVISSFKNNNEIWNTMFAMPSAVECGNYISAVFDVQIIRAVANSFLFSIGACVVVILLVTMAAYVVARKLLKCTGFLRLYYLLGLMIPPYAMLIPIVTMFTTFHLRDRYLPMIFLYAAINFPMSFYLITGFITSISRELDEAAIIDGAGPFQVLKHITVPLSKPMFATVGIMVFIWSYNDLITYLVYISDQKLKPVCVILTMVSNMHGTDYGAMMAAIFITVIPVLILYMMSQEMVIKGLTAGAVKG